MQASVWIKPGILIIYGSALDTDFHQHHALQIVWPHQQSTCLLNDDTLDGPLMINSMTEHKLNMDAGWIILIEPQCKLGEAISQLLNKQMAQALTQLHTLQAPTPNNITSHDAMEALTPLFETITKDFNLNQLSLSNDVISDHRIQDLLTTLDQCLSGKCLKPIHWRASEVAQKMALSESRFLHLFRQQMGIPWRPYLLWRRMICAISALKKGVSATDAAHLSGFSDSAHLSRSFRRHFGLSIRMALSMIKSS